ncbi:MAG: hypothetical protein O2973_03360 [Gemmatimonadetes bacterium]|nr:hypothetical protein [Gemmatimonadota bacterium]
MRFRSYDAGVHAASMRFVVGAMALAGVASAVIPSRPAHAQAHVLIVSGLGGEARYSTRFRTLGSTLAGALHSRFGVPDANIAWLGEDSTSRDPRYRGRSTRVGIEREVAAIRARARAGEQVAVFLIGHGAGSESESRISLPGPDMNVLDFQRLLGGFAEHRVVFANLTSASGDFLPLLAAPGRVVITATKTSYERNESNFAEHFVAAFASDVADTDKDDRVSMLEAFTYAARETKRVYDDATKMQTEHSQLDDNGTKVGTAEPTGREGQGMLARRYFFDARAAAAVGDVRLSALYREKFAIEEEVEGLRTKKQAMDKAAYEADLERVLVALSLKSREIRQAEGRP